MSDLTKKTIDQPKRGEHLTRRQVRRRIKRMQDNDARFMAVWNSLRGQFVRHHVTGQKTVKRKFRIS
jgi:hypothetical protein